MGSFIVLRRGEPVETSEWPSRKSRDLLKLLLAKRGRPLHREAVIDVIWPDETAASAANRLAVAVSRLRTTLDPGRDFPQDHFVDTHEDAIALNMAHVDSDVDRFLALARRGLSLASDTHASQEAMRAAIDLYGGDFLEGDAYEEWTIAVREEARATYISVALALGEMAIAAADYESAVGLYSRVLDKDPYAEPAFSGLIRAAAAVGRHGEARRHYGTYRERMAELEIEPAAFVDITA